MPTTRDYYEILGVDKAADPDDIKRAYRRLAMKHHPDRNPGDADAEAAFKEASEAYEVLSDPQKRQRYDQFGHEGVRGGGAAAHDFSRMDVSDIFSMFNDIFGGGGGGGQAGGGRTRGGVARGYDLETEVRISFKEVLEGVERDVEFSRLDVCETCHGSGAKEGSKPATCSACDGHGKVQQAGLGGMFRMITTCPACQGRGKVIKDKCETCKGKGRTPKKRTIGVKIPPGVHDGQFIRVQGEGEPPAPEASPDGAGIRGDLHVVIRVQPHEVFEREGDHLVLEMPLGFSQAALGAEIEVPTLTDKASLTIPKGTQHGAILRIQGEGLPNRRAGRRGDLVVACKIEIPRRLSSKQEDLLRQFAETEDAKVLPESHGFFDRVRKLLGG